MSKKRLLVFLVSVFILLSLGTTAEASWKNRGQPFEWTIYAAVTAPDGSVWVGADAGCVARWNGSKWESMGHSIHSAKIMAMTVEQDGSIWTGAIGGFTTRWNGTAWEDTGKLSYSRTEDVRAMTVAPDGSVWAGGYSGYLYRWNESEHCWDEIGQPRERTINSLVATNDGDILMGYLGAKCCFRWDGSSFQELTAPPSDTKRMVKAHDGAIWVGSGNHETARLDVNTWQWEDKGMWPYTNSMYGINSMTVAKDGSIWVAGSIGCAARWDGTAWEGKGQWPHGTAGTSGSGINALTFSPDGSIWAAGDAGWTAQYVPVDMGKPYLTLTKNGAEVTLSWTAADGANSYIIERSTDGNNFAEITTTEQLTYTETLNSSGTYYYRVRGQAQGYLGDYSNTVSTVYQEPGPPPTNLTATMDGKDVHLTWSGSSTSYIVQRSTDGATWTQISETSQMQYIDTNTQWETTYYYRVIGKDGTVLSDPSNVVSVTTPSPPVPADPTGLTARALSPYEVELTWDMGDATGYIIFRNGIEIARVGKVTLYNDKTVQPGTTYTYYVKAYNQYTQSEYSNPATVTTPSLPVPADPTGLTARALSPYEVELTWDMGDDATGYIIFRDGVEIARVGKVTLYNDKTVQPGTTYTYYVKAYNKVGESDYSNPATVTTPAVLTAPTGLTARALSPYEVELTWDMGDDATGYIIFRDGVEIARVGVETSYYDKTVQPDITYTYHVKAYNKVGKSEYSNPATVTTPGAHKTPLNLRATLEGKDVILNWDGQGSTSYIVQRSTDGATWTQISEISQTTYTDYDTEWNSTYYYRVIGKDDKGLVTSPSNVVQVNIPPQAPWNLRASVTGKTVNLDWDPSPGATSYIVQRSTDGATWTQISEISQIQYIDTNTQWETTYYYRVIAKNSSGQSQASNTVRVTTSSKSVSFNLRVESLQDTTVTLAWDSLQGVISYIVERSTDGQTWGQVGTSSNTKYIDQIQREIIYYYRVVASGHEPSNVVSVIASASSPVPPVQTSGLTATWSGNQIQVKWTRGDSQIPDGELKLWRQVGNNGPWMSIKTIAGNERDAFTYVDPMIAPGINCRYELRYVDMMTWSWQTIAESGWASGNGPMTAPGGLQVTVSETSATLSWDAVPGASSYTVVYSFDWGNTWQTKTVSSTSTSVPRGCIARVRSGSHEESAWSGIVTVL